MKSENLKKKKQIWKFRFKNYFYFILKQQQKLASSFHFGIVLIYNSS